MAKVTFNCWCGHSGTSHALMGGSPIGACSIAGCRCEKYALPQRPAGREAKAPHTRKLILAELRAMRAEQKTLLERIAVACEGLAAAAMAAGLEELEDPHEDALDEVLKGLDLGDLAPDAGRSADERMLDNAMGDGRPGPPEEDDA